MSLYFNTAVVKEGGAEPVIESLNITPSAQQQYIEAPTGVDGYSPITVAAVEELPDVTFKYATSEVEPFNYGFIHFSDKVLKNWYKYSEQYSDEGITDCFVFGNDIYVYYDANGWNGAGVYFKGIQTDIDDCTGGTGYRHITEPSDEDVWHDRFDTHGELPTTATHGYIYFMPNGTPDIDIRENLPENYDDWYKPCWSFDFSFDSSDNSFNLTNFQYVEVTNE